MKTKIVGLGCVLLLFLLCPLVALAAPPTVDLSVLTTPSTYFPVVNQEVTLQLVLTNSGGSSATDITVTNYLSPGLQYVSSSGSGAYNSTSGIWSVSSLGPFASVSLSVTVTAAGLGYQTNLVSVGTPGGYASDTAVLNVTLPQANLSVTTTPNNEFPVVGEQEVFQLVLTNAGPNTITTNITVTNFLSAGFEYISSTGGTNYNSVTGIWTVPGLAAFTSASIFVTTIANGSGEQTNIVTVGDMGGYSSDTAFLYIAQPEADLGITTTPSTYNPIQGQTITFQLVLTNGGPDSVTTYIAVTNFLSSGLQYLSDTSDGAYNPSTGLWTVFGLGAFSSESISVTATATGLGQQTNIVTVGIPSGYLDPNTGNNTAYAFPYISMPQADLGVTTTPSTYSTGVGQQVTFLLVLTNAGPDNVETMFTLTNFLSAGLQYISDNSGGAYNPSTGVLTFTSLVANASISVSVVAKAIAAGVQTNIITVGVPSGYSDPNLGNNTASTFIMVTNQPQLPQADLAIGQTGSNPANGLTNLQTVNVTVGQSVVFTLNVTNYGPSFVSNSVIISDLLPAGLQYVSASSTTFPPYFGAGNWADNSGMAAGEGGTLTITALATNVGTFTNTATVTTTGVTDPNFANNTSSVVVNVRLAQADLALGLLATTNAVTDSNIVLSSSITANVGSQVIFVFGLTNYGPDTINSAVSVSNFLPAGFEFVSSSAGIYGDTYNASNGVWTIPEITTYAQYTLNITATVTNSGVYTNIAIANVPPGVTDPNLANNIASVVITVPLPKADLAVGVTASTNTVMVGQQVTFMVSATNLGPNSIYSPVTITDILPSGFQYVTNVGFIPYNPTNGTWSLSGFGATNQLGMTFIGYITATAVTPGIYTNMATIQTLPGIDPNTNNNFSSVVVTITGTNQPNTNAYTVSGYVRGCQTNGAGYAFVTVTLAGPTNLVAMTDTNGLYSFTNVPSGSYMVTPTQAGNTFAPLNAVLNVTSNTNLPAFVGSGAIIQGSVTYGTNGPGIPGVLISSVGQAERTVLSDTNGHFIFTNCAPGVYTLIVQPTNGFVWVYGSSAALVLDATNCAAQYNFIARGRTVQLVALEVVQVIQDWSNSVPLISAKRTYVRAHLQLPPGSNSPPVLVTGARLYSGGLAGSPLAPLNTNGSLLVQTTNAGSVRVNWNSSLNFELPPSWTSGTISLQFVCTNNVTVVPTNTVPANSTVTVTFTPTPVLPLKMYGWNWTNAGTVQMMSQAAFADLPRRLVSLYPVPDATINAAVLVPPATLTVPLPIPPVIAMTEDLADWVLLLSNAKLAALQAVDTLLGGRFGAAGGANWIYYGAIGGPAPPPAAGGSGTIGWAKATVTSSNTINRAGGLYVSSGFIVSNFYTIDRHTHSHEIGHNLGRPHDVMANLKGVCREGAPAGTPVYPFFQPVAGATKPAIGPMTSGTNSMIYGLDTLTLNTTTMNPVVDPGVYFDVMSYCDVLPLDVWVSPYTYLALRTNIINNFTPPPAPPAPGPPVQWMYARGYLDPSTDLGGFLPFWTTKTTSTNAPPSSESGTYQVWVYDSLGNISEEIPFSPDSYVVEEGDIEAYSEGEFTVALPVVSDMHQIVVVDTLLGDQVIASITADADTPSISSLALLGTNGLPFNGVGPLVINWTGSDADPNAQLYYNIQYSTDGGNTWENIDMDVTGNSYQIDSQYFPASRNAIIRVLASDGFTTSPAMNSTTFVMPNHPPTITINTPAAGGLYAVDQQIFFDASIYDPQDGPLDGTSVQWSSSVDGVLGNGAVLEYQASDLSEGSHIITVSATDAEGLTSTATVQMFVLHQPQPGLSLQLNGNQMQISWPSSVTNFVLWTTTDLASGIWMPVNTPVAAADATQSVTVDVAGGPQFFQLRMQ